MVLNFYNVCNETTLEESLVGYGTKILQSLQRDNSRREHLDIFSISHFKLKYPLSVTARFGSMKFANKPFLDSFFVKIKLC